MRVRIDPLPARVYSWNIILLSCQVAQLYPRVAKKLPIPINTWYKISFFDTESLVQMSEKYMYNNDIFIYQFQVCSTTHSSTPSYSHQLMSYFDHLQDITISYGSSHNWISRINLCEYETIVINIEAFMIVYFTVMCV